MGAWPSALRHERPVANRIITMSAFHSEAAIARQISHVRKVPISEVVASFDRFILTSEQKGFFGNLFRIVPADPSSR